MSERDVLQNYELELPVQIADEDRSRTGVKLAETIHRRLVLLDGEAERRKTTNEEAKELEQQIEALAERVRTGYQMESVPVQEIADYDSGSIEIWRQDSGERVHSREINDDEKQLNLAV